MSAAGGPELRDLTVAQLLAAVAERTPSHGGGEMAGLAAALGAALAEMGARFAELGEQVEQAAELRADALRLAALDGAAYAPVLEAIRLPKDDPQRGERLRSALSAAAAIPLAIAETAAAAAVLAGAVARDGKPGLRGDALAGADIAAGAARAAARLVEINLAGAGEDPRIARARAAVARASR